MVTWEVLRKWSGCKYFGVSFSVDAPNDSDAAMEEVNAVFAQGNHRAPHEGELILLRRRGESNTHVFRATRVRPEWERVDHAA